MHSIIRAIIKKLLTIIKKASPGNFLDYCVEEINSQYNININVPRLSYSLEGEDLILTDLFGSKDNGFYVDVGAHHPYRYSNTYIFYRRGWRGINIDAMPGSMELFNKERPTDINIEIGISNNDGLLNYYIFNDPALNTFDKKRALLINNNNKGVFANYKIIDEKVVKTDTLGNVLRNYSRQEHIDFLSLDVEKLELEVLQSNDWKHYKPDVIVLEILDFKLSLLTRNPVHAFLQKKGYEFIAKTGRSCFYKLR